MASMYMPEDAGVCSAAVQMSHLEMSSFSAGPRVLPPLCSFTGACLCSCACRSLGAMLTVRAAAQQAAGELQEQCSIV